MLQDVQAIGLTAVKKSSATIWSCHPKDYSWTPLLPRYRVQCHSYTLCISMLLYSRHFTSIYSPTSLLEVPYPMIWPLAKMHLYNLVQDFTGGTNGFPHPYLHRVHGAVGCIGQTWVVSGDNQMAGRDWKSQEAMAGVIEIQLLGEALRPNSLTFLSWRLKVRLERYWTPELNWKFTLH